jgi:hypothetical protein
MARGWPANLMAVKAPEAGRPDNAIVRFRGGAFDDD